jgi:hypothetical protein
MPVPKYSNFMGMIFRPVIIVPTPTPHFCFTKTQYDTLPVDLSYKLAELPAYNKVLN